MKYACMNFCAPLQRICERQKISQMNMIQRREVWDAQYLYLYSVCVIGLPMCVGTQEIAITICATNASHLMSNVKKIRDVIREILGKCMSLCNCTSTHYELYL